MRETSAANTGAVEGWDSRGMWSIQRRDCGWPAPCLHSVFGFTDKKEWRFKYGMLRLPKVLGTSNGQAPIVPARPLWPGFALDTAFYGMLVFLLWSAPAVIRRRARKRRGRCSACGYDLRGSAGAPCPECGL